MSSNEEIREDAKRDAAYEEAKHQAPEPCGCQWVSECCGEPPGLRSDAATASHVGTCPRCKDHVGFERSDKNTWKYLGTTLYGDDADGNRGVLLRTYECRACGRAMEVRA
ncbi:hypothetical protein LCGC14_2777600 [marine sediment metagenome]|uniref:Uncharacterized protein n=1 Tax=marine sediment metagenome TaxID=412755 RepID=A0A0F9BKV9_9ZZZZ